MTPTAFGVFVLFAFLLPVPLISWFDRAKTGAESGVEGSEGSGAP